MYQADFSDSKLGFKQMVQSFEEISFEGKRFLKPLGSTTQLVNEHYQNLGVV